MTVNKKLLERRAAYHKTFKNPEGEKVLADLRRFCRATLPTADVNNPNVTYLLEGRREVWLRISSLLQLTEDDIYNLIEEYTNE